ncbi:MAG: acetylglutamate kinase [marine actinobacterium MedAcidi-G2B]|nr:MAG: acetylglutamate kinase [marine actinobacterium MedAcidi-G2B]MDC0246127.1 acetylglutamate kinase [Acidimicrobiaceae bacterium]|tara:strand:+ start:9308 stop:10192 length:885 start_codon:yes stop_codon:yes gene_type:complete
MNTSEENFSPERRAAVLVETLPYIQHFSGETVVVKLGGNAMVDDELASQFAQDIVLMQSVGIKPVVVHGGAPQIGSMLDRLGMDSQFVDGLRVTDGDTLDVARMVLVGKVNRDIVSSINIHGPLAVGISGEDAGLITATSRHEDLGFVGEIQAVNPTIINGLLKEGHIPIVSSIGADDKGQAYNINADTVASSLAAALEAKRILYLTDIEGLRADMEDPESHISEITSSDLQNLIDNGTISGGMIPKAQACLEAVEAGVGSAHMVDGRISHVILLELFTDSGIGTMVLPDQEKK